ncbi:MAG: rhodopsin [Candidatus Marinimicrobia bacterium]|jgi:bacteriorhodopsin|nr:rhodopsin [Candidatus Neomarinimicrobiota bacterium]MBO99736.1 rhodopsin [Candidatus Neomarinimicrobiota bacterium]MEC7902302.1 bacteriorhodopsin [Candidatus Neomarinimicrobiota bacterium]|tara:strand:+ start:2355 stop:3077 length:723 start_codon:yes stop_codon:yes gene_type:complete
MVNMLLASGLQSGDLVGFTFFLGSVAMFAATVFFFVERSSVSDEWKLSMTVSGLITLIAAVHYYYMRDVWVTSYTSPTEFRYIDWILTVPLMCVEFYLLTKTGLSKMVSASVVMLVTGYLGEASVCSVFGTHSPAIWGLISGLAYFYIVNEVYQGDVAKAAKKAGKNIQNANSLLLKFVVIGWGIYPLGYLIGTADGQWYSFLADLVNSDTRDLIYNVGDAVNKIGFGLVVWCAAKGSKK